MLPLGLPRRRRSVPSDMLPPRTRQPAMPPCKSTLLKATQRPLSKSPIACPSSSLTMVTPGDALLKLSASMRTHEDAGGVGVDVGVPPAELGVSDGILTPASAVT